MDTKFYSVTKFMNYVKNLKLFEESKPARILAWFEPNRSFSNKYNQVCIKPVALTLAGNRALTLTHRTLLDQFEGYQPVISFNRSKTKYIPQGSKLAFLSIEAEQKEFEDKVFHPGRTGTSSNKAVIQRILESRIPEDFEETNDISMDLDIKDFI